ncbi:MAG: hypothetical protein ABII07_05815 [Patescibacteria group bacterium]|nr:hypothetical protein [Patescibacteria group bacterium]
MPGSQEIAGRRAILAIIVLMACTAVGVAVRSIREEKGLAARLQEDIEVYKPDCYCTEGRFAGEEAAKILLQTNSKAKKMPQIAKNEYVGQCARTCKELEWIISVQRSQVKSIASETANLRERCTCVSGALSGQLAVESFAQTHMGRKIFSAFPGSADMMKADQCAYVCSD